MLRFLFLIPIALFLIWIVYLKTHGYSLDDGKKGFIKILVISLGIALTYLVLMWLL
ncbi:hypothetical protein GCM10027170_24090 [Aliiglaciecola aliphaticivorans]